MICDRCEGRGWVSSDRDWPDACPICGGIGELTIYSLARLLDEWPETIARIFDLEIKSKRTTTVRVLNKLKEYLP